MKRLIPLLLLQVFLFASMVRAEEATVGIFKPSLRGAQCELVTAQGTRLYVDVSNESLISTAPTANDILLTTHGHHACNLLNTFPGQQLRGVGEIKRADVIVKCIPGAHLPGDKLTETEGTNYIFLIEIAGIRFAHFGGIGQDALTAYQLKELGRVDVAFMLLGSVASLADIVNMKAFNLMGQVKPKLIISTHLDIDTAKEAAGIWETYYLDKSMIRISPNDLQGSKTKLLFLGEDARPMGKITKAPIWPG